MVITPIKTHKITKSDNDIFVILDKYIPELREKSIVAVTSKIVAFAEGRVIGIDEIDKDALIAQEAEYYLPRADNPYQVSLAIKGRTLVATAGIDESNADGNYVLWPSDPQKSANEIRAYLRERFGLSECGVIITDSRTTPLRWGVTAITIGYSGILPLRDYVGEPDLFGRPFAFETMSIIDNLASAAAVVMGEGSESTPIATITDVPFVQFVDSDPSKEELEKLQIDLDRDLYAPLLKNAPWIKGKGK